MKFFKSFFNKHPIVAVGCCILLVASVTLTASLLTMNYLNVKSETKLEEKIKDKNVTESKQNRNKGPNTKIVFKNGKTITVLGKKQVF